ncbi:hypothetical protein MCERE3_00050 [Candidatus Nanopelagicaceae bacterium]
MRISLIPRNGLGNRLQAITSAIILSKDLNAEVRILWGKETLLPLKADEIFSNPTLSKIFEECSEGRISSMLDEIPEFLSTRDEAGEIFLRGNRLGEQRFMNKIAKLLSSEKDYKQLTIVAGGQFELKSKRNTREFQKRRHLVYRELTLTEEINNDANEILDSLKRPYLALHLRSTDRGNQSIADRVLVRECIRQQKRQNIESLLIVGDSTQRIAKVWQLFQAESIAPQLSPVNDLSRTSASGSRMALLDWILLRNATAIVASESSTFAVEAAVAGGIYENSIFLRPNLYKRYRNYLKEKTALYRKFGVNPF